MNAKSVNCKSLSLIVGMVFMLLSCKHKDLCYVDVYASDVEVVFDWNKAPGAEVSSMRVFLYPAGGGNVLTYEFANMTGGVVRIPVGTYRAICINSDTEAVLFKDTQLFDKFNISTPSSPMDNRLYASLQSKFKTDPMSVQAASDDVYADRLGAVTIESTGRNQSVVFYPEQVFCHYEIRIINVSNLNYVSSGTVTGGLSGVSKGMFVGSEQQNEEASIVPFDMNPGDPSTLTTNFFTLGHPVGDEQKVGVKVSYGEGQEEYYLYDVADQIRNAKDKHHVVLTLDGMKLPKPIYNGNGFKPAVEDWEDVHIPVDM